MITQQPTANLQPQCLYPEHVVTLAATLLPHLHSKKSLRREKIINTTTPTPPSSPIPHRWPAPPPASYRPGTATPQPRSSCRTCYKINTAPPVPFPSIPHSPSLLPSSFPNPSCFPIPSPFSYPHHNPISPLPFPPALPAPIPFPPPPSRESYHLFTCEIPSRAPPRQVARPLTCLAPALNPLASQLRIETS